MSSCTNEQRAMVASIPDLGMGEHSRPGRCARDGENLQSKVKLAHLI